MQDIHRVPPQSEDSLYGESIGIKITHKMAVRQHIKFVLG